MACTQTQLQSRYQRHLNECYAFASPDNPVTAFHDWVFRFFSRFLLVKGAEMSGCFPWWKGGGSTDKKKKGATISRDANIRVTALKMKLQQEVLSVLNTIPICQPASHRLQHRQAPKRLSQSVCRRSFLDTTRFSSCCRPESMRRKSRRCGRKWTSCALR